MKNIKKKKNTNEREDIKRMLSRRRKMNKKAYDAIKMQIQEEKQEIEVEIQNLQTKKTSNLEAKQNEIKKLSFAKKILDENKTVAIGSLYQNFRADLVAKMDKENGLLDNFIAEQNIELEKLKEKEKEVDLIFKSKLDAEEKKALKKQEKVLLEYKKLKNKR